MTPGSKSFIWNATYVVASARRDARPRRVLPALLIPADKSMSAAGYWVEDGTNFSFLLIVGQYCRNRFPANFQP